MKGDKRKATAVSEGRRSLPNAEPAFKRPTLPPSTPAATNKRSTRHSTTIQSLDTRQPKTHKTQHPPPSATKQEERREAEEDGAADAAFTELCSLVNSLVALHSQSSLPGHGRHYSLLSALYRLSPPASLSSHYPPSAAVLPAVRSAAEQLIAIARAVQTVMPASSPLLQSQLQQLQSTSLPLSASDMYALLLSASVTLCQLLGRSAASHSSGIQVRHTPHHTHAMFTSPSHLNLRAVASTVRSVLELVGRMQSYA